MSQGYDSSNFTGEVWGPAGDKMLLRVSAHFQGDNEMAHDEDICAVQTRSPLQGKRPGYLICKSVQTRITKQNYDVMSSRDTG